jgi:hypothetical protein
VAFGVDGSLGGVGRDGVQSLLICALVPTLVTVSPGCRSRSGLARLGSAEYGAGSNLPGAATDS